MSIYKLQKPQNTLKLKAKLLKLKKGIPISENSPCPFLKAYVEAKRNPYLRPK